MLELNFSFVCYVNENAKAKVCFLMSSSFCLDLHLSPTANFWRPSNILRV